VHNTRFKNNLDKMGMASFVDKSYGFISD
jgi:hypothetical protein